MLSRWAANCTCHRWRTSGCRSPRAPRSPISSAWSNCRPSPCKWTDATSATRPRCSRRWWCCTSRSACWSIGRARGARHHPRGRTPRCRHPPHVSLRGGTSHAPCEL